MNHRTHALVCAALILGGTGCEALADAGQLFVDRHEIDDYHGLIYTPIVSRFYAGAVKFKLTVPVVRFMSAPSAGFYTDEALTFGRPAGATNYAELGDVTAKATKRLWQAKAGGASVDIGAKLTFATGDVNKDIGAGRTEATLLVDATQPLRSFELLAGLAYSARHSYTDEPAANGFSAYAGAALHLTSRTYLDASCEYNQASELGKPAERKLTLALNHASGAAWMLRSYASFKQAGADREQELGLTLGKQW
jgi:hypothetical protein